MKPKTAPEAGGTAEHDGSAGRRVPGARPRTSLLTWVTALGLLGVVGAAALTFVRGDGEVARECADVRQRYAAAARTWLADHDGERLREEGLPLLSSQPQLALDVLPVCPGPQKVLLGITLGRGRLEPVVTCPLHPDPPGSLGGGPR